MSWRGWASEPTSTWDALAWLIMLGLGILLGMAL